MQWTDFEETEKAVQERPDGEILEVETVFVVFGLKTFILLHNSPQGGVGMIGGLDMPGIDIDIDISVSDRGFANRYKKAKTSSDLPAHKVKYANAEKLAKEISLTEGARYDCLVSGNFIFGDLLEAIIVQNNAKCARLTISTLSMDQNNVDSLKNLLVGGYVDEMNLIIPDYFYAHERRSLIPYIYEELDIDDRFQLAVAGSHTKVILIETLGGKHIVIHGSANLRSSSNIEQFVIEENRSLYDFLFDCHRKIIDEYKTINKAASKTKSLRGKKLWNTITK